MADTSNTELLDTMKVVRGEIGTQFKALQEQYAGMDVRIKTLEQSLTKAIGASVGTQPIGKREWSWARYLAARAMKDKSIAPFEFEECAKYTERMSGITEQIMLAGDFSVGGSLIPPQYINELIGFVRAALISQRLGITVLTGLTGSPVAWPKLTSGTTAYWIGERTPPTESTPGTGRLELRPRKVGVLVKLTKELMMLSNPAIEAQIRSDMVAAIAEAIDTAVFQGTGTGGQPLGIPNWTPAIMTQAYTTTSTATKIQSFLAAMKQLENAFRLETSSAFAMNPTSYWALHGVPTTVTYENRPLIQPDVAEARRPTLLGYPIERSTLVSAAGTDHVYFGTWSALMIGIWSGLSIEASTETSDAFANDELWIKAVAFADVGTRSEKAVIQIQTVNS